MSKHNHNYSQYSNKNKTNTAKSKVVPVNEVDVVVRPELVNETIETKQIPTTVEGVVTGCAKLNVRSEPSLFSDIVYVLDTNSEIEIDVNKSNREWLYICTASGVEGYCMRKFVDVHL